MQKNFNIENIEIIIGLGNPGKDYENTYHNVGFSAIDYLKHKNAPIRKNKYFEVYKFGEIKFIKPSHYMMNMSGETVAALKKAYPFESPEKLLIVHDDSDLRLGDYKFYFDGGPAGHKGVESVIKKLRTKNFWRLRIGIRPPKEKVRQKAGIFVLKKIKNADRQILERVFEKIEKEISTGTGYHHPGL